MSNVKAQKKYFSLSYERGIQTYKQLGESTLSADYGISYFFSDKNSLSFSVELANYAKMEKLDNLDIESVQYIHNYVISEAFYFNPFLMLFQPSVKIGFGLLRQQQLKMIDFYSLNHYAPRILIYPNVPIELAVGISVLKFVKMRLKYKRIFSFYKDIPNLQSVNLGFEFELFRNFNMYKNEK